jgi:hypothetical protein
MRRFLISATLLTSLSFATEFSVDINSSKKIDRDFLNKYKFKFFNGKNISLDSVETMIRDKHLFAGEYIKNSKSNLEFDIENMVLNYLSSQYKKSFLDGIKLSDDILKSYYVAHKSKYERKEMLDLYQISFSSKEEALKFKKEYSKLKTEKFLNSSKNRRVFKSIVLETLPTNYQLYLSTLKEKELSDAVLLDGSNYYLIYFKNRVESGYYSFEEVKSSIEKYLLNKKKRETLNRRLKELKAK